MASTTTRLKVDTGYLRELSSDLKTAKRLLDTAAAQVNKARRHTNWKCNQESLITNEVDLIKGGAERISRYVDRLSAILADAAGEFESGQSKTVTTIQNLNRVGL
jgi:hypothetical protein